MEHEPASDEQRAAIVADWIETITAAQAEADQRHAEAVASRPDCDRCGEKIMPFDPYGYWLIVDGDPLMHHEECLIARGVEHLEHVRAARPAT